MSCTLARLTEHFQVEPEIAAIAADQQATEDTLASFGLNPQHLLAAWTDYGYGQGKLPDGSPCPDVLDIPQYTAHSLRNVIELEKRTKGAALELNKNNNIYNFGRYTVNYLTKLHETDVRACGNVVLAACAAGDHNGALWDSASALERLDETLPDHTSVVIDEFYNDTELVRRWIHYADLGVKACHFVIAGHGSREEIESVKHYKGRGCYRSTISEKHVTGELGDVMKQLAAPGASTLLLSCNTGAGKDNLAHAFFKHTGLPTAAPLATVELHSLRGRWQKSQLHITPGFYRSYPQDDNHYAYRRSPARRYRLGPPPL